MGELKKVGSRGYTENFLNDPPDRKDMLYDEPHTSPTHHPCGIIRDVTNTPLIDIRNPLIPGDKIEYLAKGLSVSVHKITEIRDEEGRLLEKANPGNLVRLVTTPEPDGWEKGGLLRKEA